MENEKVVYNPLAINGNSNNGLLEGLVLSMCNRHEGHRDRFEHREEFARDIASRVDERIFKVEKETLKQGFEDRLKLVEIENKIFNKMDCDKSAVENKIVRLETDVNKHFCELSHKVEKGFFDVEQKELRAEVAKLKEELCDSRQTIQTTNIIASILGALGVAIPPAIPAAKKA